MKIELIWQRIFVDNLLITISAYPTVAFSLLQGKIVCVHGFLFKKMALPLISG